MLIGIPKEIKKLENRVAVMPGGVEELVAAGHRVLIEAGAGLGSDCADTAYVAAGAECVEGPDRIWAEADLIVKVKEPQPDEYPKIRDGQIIFTYFHFAASEELTLAMRDSGCIAVAYETIQTADRKLPLLTPMSEVAGRMAMQQAAKYLERAHGGRGVLVGGIAGVAPANVLILGGGVVGTNAAKMAAGMGARVVLVDVSLDRLRYLDDIMPENVVTLMSNAANIRELSQQADVIIGGVLIPGGKAPKLITREHLKSMKRGAVLVDVAIDQGGSFETSRPTTHDDPVFEVDGVMHYCVANMPGAVPVTSTIALTNATQPYIRQIADLDWKRAVLANPALRRGVNIARGEITYPAVAEAFGLPYQPPEEVVKE
ncbi:MAG: alanine dehydrogenase [Opitutales bacterium]